MPRPTGQPSSCLIDDSMQTQLAPPCLKACAAASHDVRHTNGAHLVSSVFLRLLATMSLRLLVILLGRLLPCSNQQLSLVCHCCKHRENLPLASQLLTASCTPCRVAVENWISCARSADTCGLREFHPLFRPAIHPRRQPPENSVPDGNTRFAPSTLVLFEGKLTFPHLQLDGSTPPATTQGKAREPHGFTFEGIARGPVQNVLMLQCPPSVPLSQRNQASMPS